jgi:hypothetical protein
VSEPSRGFSFWLTDWELPDTDADADTYADANADTYWDTDTDTYWDTDADADSDTYSNTYTYGDANTYAARAARLYARLLEGECWQEGCECVGYTTNHTA